MGLTIPPCGVPLRVGCRFQSFMYPAWSSRSTSRRKRLSWIVSWRIDSKTFRSMLSNEAVADVVRQAVAAAVQEAVEAVFYTQILRAPDPFGPGRERTA